MAYSLIKAFNRYRVLGPRAQTGSYTGWSLSGGSTYVLGSSGNCVGVRFLAPVTSTIAEVYLFLTACPVSANDLRCDITAGNESSGTKPNTGTIIATKSTSGGTIAQKWIKFVFDSPPSCTFGEVYWVVVGDATVAASGYSVLTRSGALGDSELAGGGASGHLGCLFSHTSGFSNNGTLASSPHTWVVKFGDGSWLGNPFTNNSAHASSTNERGNRFWIEEDIKVRGCVWYAPGAATNSLRCYEDDTLPGGTIYSGFNGGSAITLSGNQPYLGATWFDECLLRKGHSYRFVLKPSTANAAVYTMYVDDYAAFGTAILEMMGSLIKICDTEEDSGAWKDYNNDTDGYRMSAMPLYLGEPIEIPRAAQKLSQVGGLILR